MTSEQNISVGKAFTLNFLQEPFQAFQEQDEWLWQPVKSLNVDSIQTATFCGKNQADDYQNE